MVEPNLRQLHAVFRIEPQTVAHEIFERRAPVPLAERRGKSREIVPRLMRSKVKGSGMTV